MFLRKTTFIQMAENQMLTRGQWFDNGGSEAHTRGRGGAIWGEEEGKRKGGGPPHPLSPVPAEKPQAAELLPGRPHPERRTGPEHCPAAPPPQRARGRRLVWTGDGLWPAASTAVSAKKRISIDNVGKGGGRNH